MPSRCTSSVSLNPQLSTLNPPWCPWCRRGCKFNSCAFHGLRPKEFTTTTQRPQRRLVTAVDSNPHSSFILHPSPNYPYTIVRHVGKSAHRRPSGMRARSLRFRTVSLKYHQATFDLISIVPTFDSAAAAQLSDIEEKRSFQFPAAVREWYSQTGAVDLLARYSNGDHPVAIGDLRKPKPSRKGKEKSTR